MGIFGKFLQSKSIEKAVAKQLEQAVLVYLNATDLPQAVYDENDLMTIEDQLTTTLDGTGLGALDGNEVGLNEVVLYLYGANAEELFAKIEPVLRNYPLCQRANVFIRQGEPGSIQREVTLS